MDRSFYNKEPSYGLELSRDSDLDFRLIKPWFIGGKITGYIEMGVSFDNVIPQIKEILSVDIIITVKKEYLQKKEWETQRERNRDLHRWNRYGSFVILKSTLNRNDVYDNENIEAHIKSFFENNDSIYRTKIGGVTYNSGQFKLVDIAGQHIGDVLVLNKISERISQLYMVKAAYILFIVLVSGLLLLFFWKYFGKVENELYTTHGMNELILSAVASPMMLIDIDYIIKNLNKYTEQILGKVPADLIDKNLFESNIPWENSRVREILETTKKNGEPSKGHEVAFSKERIIGMSVYPIKDSTGETSGFLLTGADITEKKINEKRKNIEQKLISLGELSAGVAHEINTPSHYIMSNLDFLKNSMEDISGLYKKLLALLNSFTNGSSLKKKQLSDLSDYITEKDIDYLFTEIPGAIDQSLDGINHITKIVKSMKSLAQPDMGEKIQVNINEMIGDMITISKNEWKYSAEVTYEPDYSTQEIVCNPAEINQVLLELITNSTYAISEKIKTGAYDKGEIEITTRREDGMAVIKVKDNGTGIPEEVKDRVFDPFFTTREVGKGVGSGLSYVYAIIVKTYGGSIDINSSVDTGTEFIIKLPVS
jgi:PAS domain S-box-containing protein